ncbi:MAG: nickel pincer cofactor biosynthesis protein LarC [Deltaproteobacteria bacterium]|nr:nickel pincer cofactor biosynthesis protein LarC [Deltaproteobacteria bacterium]
MKILYIDAPMGISGDMFLGAMIDMGVPFKAILRELKKLNVGNITIDVRKEVRHSIIGTAFRVRLKEARHHRTFREIRAIIKKSGLSPAVKGLSIRIFGIIAEAEGKVHGISADKVHFHEVGAMDSIIDIVGASTAFTSLSVDRVVTGPIPLGGGWTDTMHGRLPIPAPATLEILKGVPVASSNVPFELTTPTGAAIVKAITDEFGPIPDMAVQEAGYGAGKKDFKEAANVLRVIIGKAEAPHAAAAAAERLCIMETNIDDMNPQIAGYLMERLLKAGALDAFFTPVQMKKSRPGVLLTVLTSEEKKKNLLDIILDESTSIGVRTYPVERHCLERRMENVKTGYGVLRVKVSLREGLVVNVQPEYEDCRTIAGKKKIPLKMVMDAAKAALLRKGGPR